MIQKIHIITFIFIGLHFVSCANRKKETPPNTETPKALQKLEYKSRGSGYQGLVEALYKEMLEKNENLKKLEAEIDSSESANFYAESSPFANFNTYNQYSQSYYNDAEGKLNQIKDTVLRKKMLAIIQASKEIYANNISEHTNLIAEFNQNQANINDQHLAMKVLLTLPLIVKYQKENIPSDKESKKIIENQHSLIEKMGNTIK